MIDKLMRWLGYEPIGKSVEQMNPLPVQEITTPPARLSKLDKLAAMIVEGIKFEATNPELGPLPHTMEVGFVANQFADNDGDNALLKVLEAKGGLLTIVLKLQYAMQEPTAPPLESRPPLPVGMVGSVVEGGM